MASSQNWVEFNGANAGTPTSSRGDGNWKAIDDSTTAYSTSPIVAGNNSMAKYQALMFTGTFNNLSAMTYKLSAAGGASRGLNPNDSSGTSTRLAVQASVICAASFTTPSTTSTGDPSTTANFTNGTGVAVGFATSTGPYGATTSTFAGGGTNAATVYAQALRTQLIVNAAAAPGDIELVTITAGWTES